MTHSGVTNRPLDLDPLLHQISQAHASPDDESITEAAIIASVNYLELLPTEVHWLCTSSPLLPVVVQATQLWGYGEPPAQAALEKFRPALAAALSRCPDCAVEWELGCRRELRRVFTQVYSYDEGSTTEFYIALEGWDANRVGAELANALKVVERIPMAWKHIEVRGPMVESLAQPNLLLKEGVYKLWRELYYKLDKMPAGVGEKWVPGALVLLFDSDIRVRRFGEDLFKKRNSKIGVLEFDADFGKALATLIRRESQKVGIPVTKLTLAQQRSS
jgi:hypothetical protein